MRRKTRLLQGQLREVSDERAELTARLNDAHRETTALAKQLGSAARECEDLSLAAEATRAAASGTKVSYHQCDFDGSFGRNVCTFFQ